MLVEAPSIHLLNSEAVQLFFSGLQFGHMPPKNVTLGKFKDTPDCRSIGEIDEAHVRFQVDFTSARIRAKGHMRAMPATCASRCRAVS